MALSGDRGSEPDELVITVDTGERIAFLDWGGPLDSTSTGVDPEPPPLLLVHGLSGTGWAWAPVARRLRRRARVLTPDLRGHGLSDSPRQGYDLESLAFDMLTVLTACGFGPDAHGPPAVVAGHGFGALVAGTMAALRPQAVAGLGLVDAGWETAEAATGMDAAELLRTLQDPPEVMRSMAAYLADRREYDPGSWDVDQERAARAAVDEKHQGRVVPLVRRWALGGCVAAMFAYQPDSVLTRYQGPTLVCVAEAGGADDEAARERRLALGDALRARSMAGLPEAHVARFGGVGHNLMRYRADELATELAGLLEAARLGAGYSQR